MKLMEEKKHKASFVLLSLDEIYRDIIIFSGFKLLLTTFYTHSKKQFSQKNRSTF
jgi:hypothetical protein